MKYEKLVLGNHLTIVCEGASPVYDLNQRIKEFVVQIFDLVKVLPKSQAGRSVENQIVRSVASVGANYRASRRARSSREYIAKLGIALEEADETCYWLEIIEAAGWIGKDQLKPYQKEIDQITAILVSMIKKAKGL